MNLTSSAVTLSALRCTEEFKRKAKSIIPMGGTKREQHITDTKQI